MVRTLLITALAAMVPASIAAAPQSAVVRGGVDQVRVDVHVTDSHGNPVTDLQPGDLQIADDGQPQQILTFAVVKPGAPPYAVVTMASTPRAPDVAAPSAPAPESLAIVIVLDDLHVAAANTPRVTGAVKSFLDNVVSPADSVAVVFTSGESGGGQEFTSDRTLVVSALERFRGQKLRSAAVERQQDPLIRRSGKATDHIDPVEPERENRARIVMDALGRIGEALGRTGERRRLVLLVSEGPEYQEVQRRRSGTSDQWSMNDGVQRAVQSLNRANAVVYAIDPRGVSTGNPAQIESSSTSPAPARPRFSARTCSRSVCCRRSPRTPAGWRDRGGPT
jgi:VWFA-related protein